MRGLLAPLKNMKEFQSLCRGLGRGHKQQLVFGLAGSQRAYLAAGIAESCASPVLIVTAGEQEAGLLADDLSALLSGARVFHFPVLQLLPYQVLAHGREVLASRLKVLEALIDGQPSVVVTSAEGLMRRLSPPEIFRRANLEIMVGQRIEPEKLKYRLAELGYERVDLVEGRGQFSARGGIIDVFPSTGDMPCRLEFFDDEVDSVRSFDPDTQRSAEKLSKVNVLPAGELVLEPPVREAGIKALEAEYRTQMKRISRESSSEARRQLEDMAGTALERIRTGLHFPGLEQFLPYFYPHPVTLADYFPAGVPVLVDEPARFKEVVEVIEKERAETYADLLAKGRVLPGQYRGYAGWQELEQFLRRLNAVYLSFLPRQPQFLGTANVVTFPVKGMHVFLGRVDILVDDVRHWKRNGYAVALLAGSGDRARQLLQGMKDAKIDAYHIREIAGDISPGNVVISEESLSGGFELVSGKLVVVTESEMYGQRRRSRRNRIRQAPKLDTFTELKKGDYVVHVNHGIGRYLGIISLNIDGINKDYLQVKYAGEDKLYVPTDQVGMIQKYLGAEADAPRLSKLGGAEWNRVKGRVKEAVREMAQDLLALYAARETARGHAFGTDTVWQKEFEANFPYEETPDQLRAIAEVKKDMERPRPMDRLLCGDVGYGKTEVALRAAFKSIMDGKQVAVLVPTTILAQQHYNTFRERFAPYPVKVEMLSRFRSPREQKAIIADLTSGKLDIIIGTHRLVQEDVVFKDLGFLVVDEEQRFGVTHKERLKQIKNNVDVLTLTATPIPRTLHMSLVGARDTSILETPPEDRFPVQTYVLEEDPAMIREAILREMGRGGQVFFVHNRIIDLDRLASWLAELVPDARLAIGHGQMKEDDLEQVMLDFMDNQYDVLVCTTIIESGLDIPNVNTLIVKDANNMGLAQLYQLRGRVGRSSRLAYAYLTYRRDRILNEVAEKRLAAIREFTEFGSGYKIAMRDLEIRGAGNLLGAEQHGHIAAVGFDLYCRLLEEAVREARGEEHVGPVETSIELPVEAYLPDGYVPDSNQKVELYRRIAHFREESEVGDIEEEMVDRFGDLPVPARNLLRIATLKIIAGKYRMRALAGQPGFFKLQFAPGHVLTGETLVRLVQTYKNRVKFNDLGGEFEIKLKAPGYEDNLGHYLDVLEDFLRELGGCS
ncbi:MAG: transcription-repair coupling factor [Peptococcaceae bacterium BRH_c4b]|nr:MAG: transcription-repair coupling factor [Peptococcaceae bacterium BRH_c4b]